MIFDRLEAGWHQFLVSWDRNTPKLIFSIDLGAGGQDISGLLLNWPEQLSDSVIFGAWHPDYAVHNSSTGFFNIVIRKKFIDLLSGEVKNHYEHVPSTNFSAG